MTRRRLALEQAVAAVELRYGPAAIRTASAARQASPLPTGFPALDALLSGGLPQGKCHELIGYGTAGHFTVAATTLAQAQRSGQAIVYVDLGCSVDPESLVRCDVRLDTLVILRPKSFRQALSMVSDLVRTGGTVATVLDRVRLSELSVDQVGVRTLELALREWIAALDRSSSTLLFLTETASPPPYPASLPLAHFAHVRLWFERQSWLSRGTRIVGFTSQVTVLKHKSAASGKTALLRCRIT